MMYINQSSFNANELLASTSSIAGTANTTVAATSLANHSTPTNSNVSAPFSYNLLGSTSFCNQLNFATSNNKLTNGLFNLTGHTSLQNARSNSTSSSTTPSPSSSSSSSSCSSTNPASSSTPSSSTASTVQPTYAASNGLSSQIYSKNYNMYPYNFAYYNPQLTCTFPGLTPTTNTTAMAAASSSTATTTNANNANYASSNPTIPLASYNSQQNQENQSQALLKTSQFYSTLSTASNINSSPNFANFSNLNDNKCKYFLNI